MEEESKQPSQTLINAAKPVNQKILDFNKTSTGKESKFPKILFLIFLVLAVGGIALGVKYFFLNNQPLKRRLEIKETSDKQRVDVIFSTRSDIDAIKQFSVDEEILKNDLENLGIEQLIFNNPESEESGQLVVSELIFSLTSDEHLTDYKAKDSKGNLSTGFGVKQINNSLVNINIYLSHEILESNSQDELEIKIYRLVLWSLTTLSEEYGRKEDNLYINLYRNKVNNNIIPVSISLK